MVEDEAFKALMAKLGERIQYMSGEDFEKWWEQDYQKVGALLRQLIKNRISRGATTWPGRPERSGGLGGPWLGPPS